MRQLRVLVTGPPKSGKSRLADRMARYLADEQNYVVTISDEGEETHMRPVPPPTGRARIDVSRERPSA